MHVDHLSPEFWALLISIIVSVGVLLMIQYAAISLKIGRLEKSVEATEMLCSRRGDDHRRHFEANEAVKLALVKLAARVGNLESADNA